MRKIIIASLILVSFLVVQANAESFVISTGYQGTVVASDDDNPGRLVSEEVHGSSLEMCQQNYLRAIDNFEEDGYTYVKKSSLECFASHSVINVVDVESIVPKLEVPPSCISCLYFNKDTIKDIFPNHYYEMMNLYYSYNIYGYNKQLRQLQQQYNLSEFDHEVYKVINDIQK